MDTDPGPGEQLAEALSSLPFGYTETLLELPLVKSCSAHVSTIWFLVAPKFQSYTKVFRPIFELIFVHNGRKESSLSLPQVDFSGGGAQL